MIKKLKTIDAGREVISEKAVENHPFSTEDFPGSNRLIFRDAPVRSALMVTSDLRGSTPQEQPTTPCVLNAWGELCPGESYDLRPVESLCP